MQARTSSATLTVLEFSDSVCNGGLPCGCSLKIRGPVQSGHDTNNQRAAIKNELEDESVQRLPASFVGDCASNDSLCLTQRGAAHEAVYCTGNMSTTVALEVATRSERHDANDVVMQVKHHAHIGEQSQHHGNQIVVGRGCGTGHNTHASLQ
jgi:hypothetical protein